ncbi:uncharacterized protein LOC106088263 [Stomoxys calcitrans]|uniref:uncharacterized protein LOC106088263 n=1 Tax=Stomoxys calcitrans TaxID=35570 RepID=UPI0027E238E4|nr:uncharacterized protein LOC106088263 [Stomoxys calcitrans]
MFNDDELVPPTWIDSTFLENALTKYGNNKTVEIIKFDLSPATMKGDHYASVMFRCKLEYRCPETSSHIHKSLIIKTIPDDEKNIKYKFLTEGTIFETEISMYAEVIPKIEKILAECGEPTKLAPNLIYYSLEPYKVIVLEDLCVEGYQTLRGRYLDDDEVKIVYGKLAKLHAVTYMLGHSEDQESVTKFQDGFKVYSLPMMKEMQKNGIKQFINMLSSHEDFKVYAEKFKAMENDLHSAYKNIFRAFALKGGDEEDAAFVLNHGDFHLKNLLFTLNNKQKVEDVQMVDFQLSSYAPSNLDLTYSQYLLLSSDQRMRRDEFMQYYFSEFVRILKKIQYQGELPKYSEFQMAALKYRHHSVCLLSTMLPIVIGFFSKTAEELKDIQTAELSENRDLDTPYFYEADFIAEDRKLLPKLLYEGYLD